MKPPQNWRQWVRAVEKGGTPSLLTKGSLAPLTGTDVRAMDVFVAAMQLFPFDKACAIGAAAFALEAMQEKVWWIARELIPFALDWSDRETVWRAVEGTVRTRRATSGSPRG